MKQRLLAIVLTSLMVLLAPTRAFAQEGPPPEARLKGYGQGVTSELEPKSTALTWFIMFAMAGACVGVMFKNAKRSHLD